jgi:hypothetical protein
MQAYETSCDSGRRPRSRSRGRERRPRSSLCSPLLRPKAVGPSAVAIKVEPIKVEREVLEGCVPGAACLSSEQMEQLAENRDYVRELLVFSDQVIRARRQYARFGVRLETRQLERICVPLPGTQALRLLVSKPTKWDLRPVDTTVTTSSTTSVPRNMLRGLKCISPDLTPALRPLKVHRQA